jgi:mannose-1-phosphate guanylyltransferase
MLQPRPQGGDDEGLLAPRRELRGAPSISLDYAIIEKARNIACVPLATSWSDVGSWSTLWNFLDKDEQGNVGSGGGKTLFQEASGNYV